MSLCLLLSLSSSAANSCILTRRKALDGVILVGSLTWIGKGWGGASKGAQSSGATSCNSDLRPFIAARLLTISVLVHGVNKSHHFSLHESHCTSIQPSCRNWQLRGSKVSAWSNGTGLFLEGFMRY